MRRRGRFIALVAAALLVAAACGSSKTGQQQTPGPSGLKKGGVLKIALISDVHQAMDPAKEYYTIGWEFLHCCLTRTLLGFNLKGPNEGGNDLIPDLATALPTVSSDGLQYTFHIRSGVHYSPPLQTVTVQAQDFIRGLLRVADSSTAASYPFYYSDIKGFDDVTNKKAKTITGLSAPDPSTLVVTLSHPVGHFPYVMTLPAASPIPASPSDPNAPLGVATGHANNYGQFGVSTGPYMFKGADQIDYSQPASKQKGPGGFVAGKSYVLVRNTAWDPATDPSRKAYLNEIDVTVGGAVPDVQNKISSGELDTMDALPNPEGIRTFVTSSQLKPFIHSDSTFGTYYVNMNTAMAPFDDVHVRKALNWMTDKAGLLRLAGGSILGPIATHDLPNTMLPSLKSYDPYATPNSSGSLAKAKAEMMQSKYDTNHDGLCDAAVCKNVLMVVDQTDPFPKMATLVQQNLEALGIKVNMKQFTTTTAYTKCETATSQVQVCPSEGWYADFGDPYAFVTQLFRSSALTPSCCGDAEMGATSAQLAGWHYANTTPTPNIDSQLDACVPTAGTQRLDCYAAIDKTLMETVVPWVPYRFANEVVITSSRVQNYHMNASTGWISIALLALK